MLGVASLTSIAKNIGIHRTTLSRRFNIIDSPSSPIPLRPLDHPPVIVLDGTAISKTTVLIVAYDTISNQPLAWSFVSHEKFDVWHALLIHISASHKPHAIVSDGQKGLLKAVKTIFPNVPHQRCLAHIIRLSLAWLTRNPQTLAGLELRILIRNLALVKTPVEASAWRASFLLWNVHYESFLKEKSVNPATNRKWYTHRKLRAVRSLVLNALPNLFWFTGDANIPNTTNTVEGGINAVLAELIHRHRGITEQQKKALVRRFLYARRKKKSPTRNAT
jgi:putative transposase